MPYTEIKERNGNKYYYRVLSVRNGKRVGKKRTYLGVNLDKKALKFKEIEANNQISKEKINKNISKIKSIILPILIRYKIKKAGIFGSYARGEQKKNSDIDILVQPTENMGFEFVGLGLDLEKALKKVLKKKADLVSHNGLSPYLRERILNDEIRIL